VIIIDAQYEKDIPYVYRELQDTVQFFNLTTGSQTKDIPLYGTVKGISEISVSVGSVGNEWIRNASFSVFRTNTVASIDESYPSDNLLGKVSMNNANVLFFDKIRFSEQDLKIVINHNAGTNKLTSVNVKYYSK